MKTLFYTISINYEPASVTLPLWKEKASLNNSDFRIIDRHHYPAEISPIYNKSKGPELFPGYDQYIYFDADTIPGQLFRLEDFFAPGRLSVARDLFGLRWIQQGVNVFKSLVPDTNFRIDNNWNSGVFAYDASFNPYFRQYDQWVILSSKGIYSSIRAAGSKGIFVGKEQTQPICTQLSRIGRSIILSQHVMLSMRRHVLLVTVPKKYTGIQVSCI